MIPQSVHVDEAVPKEPVTAASCWPCEEVDQREGEQRRWSEAAQAERVHQDEPSNLFPVCDGESGCDGTAEQMPGQVGRQGAGLLDEFSQPREHTVGAERRVTQRRSAVTRKVGHDQAIGLGKLRHHPHPGEGEPSRTMQHDDRGTVRMQRALDAG